MTVQFRKVPNDELNGNIISGCQNAKGTVKFVNEETIVTCEANENQVSCSFEIEGQDQKKFADLFVQSPKQICNLIGNKLLLMVIAGGRVYKCDK